MIPFCYYIKKIILFQSINKSFLRVFQQTKRLKNVQMFLVQIKNIFIEKNILSLIFSFRDQFFLCYKTFDLNTWRNELNLEKQTKIYTKFKKGVLRHFAQFTGKHLCQSFFFNKLAALGPATLLKKETLAQVFPCEFYEISKTTFLEYKKNKKNSRTWSEEATDTLMNCSHSHECI